MVVISHQFFIAMKIALSVCLAICLSSASVAQTIDGCPVFPADNPWNLDISGYPVHEMSETWISKINEGQSAARQRLHPDWGSPREYGIPFMVVDNSTPKVEIVYTDYGDESDPGPMPIPPNAMVEGGDDATGDRHVLIINKDECKLYELFNAHKHQSGNGWNASSGAIFDLTINDHHPDGWTSADAAGLPIFPGLVRYDEVKAGEIKHALRFTVPKTRRAYIHPARHYASQLTDAAYMPMGVRFRLKADFDISGFSNDAKVILTALKKYGMMLADNGSNWFITGATDPRWDDDAIGQLKQVPSTAFEAVNTGKIKFGPEASVTTAKQFDIKLTKSETGWIISGFEDRGVAEVFDLLGHRTRSIDLSSTNSIEIPFSGALQFIRVDGHSIKLPY
jgi:hypothetical protein